MWDWILHNRRSWMQHQHSAGSTLEIFCRRTTLSVVPTAPLALPTCVSVGRRVVQGRCLAVVWLVGVGSAVQQGSQHVCPAGLRGAVQRLQTAAVNAEAVRLVHVDAVGGEQDGDGGPVAAHDSGVQRTQAARDERGVDAGAGRHRRADNIRVPSGDDGVVEALGGGVDGGTARWPHRPTEPNLRHDRLLTDMRHMRVHTAQQLVFNVHYVGA